MHRSLATRAPALLARACNAMPSKSRQSRISAHQGCSETLHTAQADESFECYAYSAGEGALVLILFSDIFGSCTRDHQALCERLRDEENFTVLAPDAFVRDAWPAEKQPGWLESPNGDYVSRVAAATAQYALSTHGQWVAIAGMGVGGGQAINAVIASQDAAVPLFGAAVAFYGTLIDQSRLSDLETPVALYFAQNDHLVLPDAVSSMRQALRQAPAADKCQFKVFAQQPHGFVHQEAYRDEPAAHDALFLAVRFLKSVHKQQQQVRAQETRVAVTKQLSPASVWGAAAVTVTREEFTFTTGDTQTACVRVSPGSSTDAPARSKRAIVFLSDVYGARSVDTERFTATIAADARAEVYVPDLFQGVPWHPDGPPAGSDEYEQWRDRVPGDWAVRVAENCAQAALDHGAASVVLVGTCFGGGRVVDALARDSAAARLGERQKFNGGVAFYGTRIDPERLRQVRAPVALMFGAADHLVSAEQISEMRKVATELRATQSLACTVTVFANQPHGFVHQAGAGDADAASDAWFMGLRFIESL